MTWNHGIKYNKKMWHNKNEEKSGGIEQNGIEQHRIEYTIVVTTSLLLQWLLFIYIYMYTCYTQVDVASLKHIYIYTVYLSLSLSADCI